jgi:hypothetical protein
VSPFGNGLPKERRRPGDHPKVGGNRDDDPDLIVAKGVVRWSRWFATKKVAITAIAAMLSAVGTWIVLSLGLTTRVDALEAGFRSVRGEVDTLHRVVTELQNSDRDKLYMLCALHERAIPNAITPRTCRENATPNP